MAESRFNRGGFKSAPRAGARPENRAAPGTGDGVCISCRATNPISIQDDLGGIFLDEQQAKATTATRLFRNNELFSAIAKVVLPAFFAARRTKFSLWSTGCSSGEEVYSLAMIALNEFERAGRQPRIEAFGTDINPNRILEGRKGVYIRPSRDALSQNCWRLLEKYAEISARGVRMGPRLRSVCRFTIFDMRKRPKNHAFFFIVCNHVLQYYDAPGQRHIIENLKAVLNPGGFLYLEGITEQGLAGSGLVKRDDNPYLYTPAGTDGFTGRE